MDELRRDLYHRLPQKMVGLFTARERKSFIKTSVFHFFSVEALELVGLTTPDDPALVCFMKERENSVHRLNKVTLLQITD